MGSACLEVRPRVLRIPELLSAEPAARRHGYTFARGRVFALKRRPLRDVFDR
jgi:hypothetical protein